MKSFYYIFSILFVLSCFTSCKDKESAADVVILYTTDVHGNVLPYDFTLQKSNKSSLANASTLIKEVRNEYGNDLILIDDGDLFQGTPAMYYYNYFGTDQNHVVSKIANYLGYNGIIVGNHDLDAGENISDKIKKEINMPLFGANSIDTRINMAMFRPYKIFERHGFRIAVIGFITPETGDQIPKNLIPHLAYGSMTDYARRWISEIKNMEKPDYIIGVVHSGIKSFDYIRANGDTIKDGITQVIENVEGFDLILFGHDHEVYNDDYVTENSDTVRLLQPAAHGAEIGRVDIHLSRNEDKSVTKVTETQRISLEDYPIDEDYMKEFGNVIDTVNNFLDRPLGYLTEELDMVGTLYKQTNSMDLVHQIQLETTGAEISLASALSTFRNIPAGPITLRTLFTLYKYDNQVHKIWMNGYELKKFLEYGCDRQFGVIGSNHNHLLAFKYDSNGKITYGRFGPDLVVPQYNYTSAAGINYEIDVRKPLGDRITILSMADGSPFEYNRQYTVAISSYQAAGGGGFISRGLEWSKEDIAYHTLSISKHTIIYLMAKYLEELQNVTPKANGHWKVIPEAWALNAGREDSDLLIPYISK